MLLFPPSSIQEPLRDSTNRKCLTHSTGSWKSTARDSPHLTDLGISDVGSSDTSIYNASTAPSCISNIASTSDQHQTYEHSNFASSQRLHSTRMRAKSEGPAQEDMVRFVNRPHGTPLFAIAEQKSLATIRTQTSFSSFRKRGSTYLGTTSSGKPKAASVDDTILSATRSGSLRNTETSSYVDDSHSGIDPVHPLHPPFGPPHRVKTPEGVPQWHANTRVSFLRRMTRMLSSARSLSLRNGTRYIMRTVRGEIQSRRRIQLQRWRPPVSGHSTYGYTQPAEHPLNNVPSAALLGLESNRQEEPPASPIPAPTVADKQSLDRRCRSLSVDTPYAQRTLGAIYGSAIPTNPARALRARSVSIPRKLRIPESEPDMALSTQNQQPFQGREPYPSDTMRTIEIIERFPRPPSRLSAKTRGKLQFFAPMPERAPSISFLGNVDTSTNAPGSQDWASNDGYSASRDADNRSFPTEVESDIGPSSTPPIRGEQARYTFSGMPIYRDDAASLQSHDRLRIRRMSDMESLDHQGVDAVWAADHATQRVQEGQLASTNIESRSRSLRRISNDENMASEQDASELPPVIREDRQIETCNISASQKQTRKFWRVELEQLRSLVVKKRNRSDRWRHGVSKTIARNMRSIGHGCLCQTKNDGRSIDSAGPRAVQLMAV